MIITVHGHTQVFPMDGEIIFDSSEFLCAQGVRKGRTFVWLKHNIATKEDEGQSPFWIICEESPKEVRAQMLLE